MSKYARFNAQAPIDGWNGYTAGLTVAQGEKLDKFLIDFKQWFASVGGFGNYLRRFFTDYQAYFSEFAEEHSLVYTQLHKEFCQNLEDAVDAWLRLRGLSEDDFGDMLRQAERRGDSQSDEMLGVLLGLLDYQPWIHSIFALRHAVSENFGAVGAEIRADLSANEMCCAETLWTEAPGGVAPNATTQVMFHVAVPDGVAPGQQLQVTSPDGQSFLTCVPDGVGPGQLFCVSYSPAVLAA